MHIYRQAVVLRGQRLAVREGVLPPMQHGARTQQVRWRRVLFKNGCPRCEVTPSLVILVSLCVLPGGSTCLKNVTDDCVSDVWNPFENPGALPRPKRKVKSDIFNRFARAKLHPNGHTNPSLLVDALQIKQAYCV